jgi:hypothetical protein
MDRGVIEMLMQQNQNTVKDFVQILFNSLKTEISDLRKENIDMKQSLEFTQAELRAAQEKISVNSGNSEHSINTGTVTRSDFNIDALSERVRYLEDYSRRQNILVDGIPEGVNENNENLQVAVRGLFVGKMQVNPDIEHVNRIGSADNRTADRPRPIIVRFKSFTDRQSCLRSATSLKGTNIFLNDDVSRATQEIRRGKLAELKQKRSQGLIAYFSGANIVTKPRGVTRDQVDQGLDGGNLVETPTTSHGVASTSRGDNTSAPTKKDSKKGKKDDTKSKKEEMPKPAGTREGLRVK